MSPIFVIVMEYLSRLLVSRFQNRQLQYHPRCARLHISHVLFADDIMIFRKASSKNVAGILQVLYEFVDASCLHCNMSKIQVFLSDVEQRLANQIVRIMEMEIGFFLLDTWESASCEL